MKINRPSGNMYKFITGTGNAIKGACLHDCSYCYMKTWGALKPVRLDESELRGDLPSGEFLFIGSSCDMFAEDIPTEWITRVIDYCGQYNNRYLFQSKNPGRMVQFVTNANSVLCTTIETNRWYPDVMRNCPPPEERGWWLGRSTLAKYVTVEPVMDFDLLQLVELIRSCNPTQVNIGADSKRSGLPEPTGEKIGELVSQLKLFTTVEIKSNLRRLFYD